jgi:hypothetical protein
MAVHRIKREGKGKGNNVMHRTDSREGRGHVREESSRG